MYTISGIILMRDYNASVRMIQRWCDLKFTELYKSFTVPTVIKVMLVCYCSWNMSCKAHVDVSLLKGNVNVNIHTVVCNLSSK